MRCYCCDYSSDTGSFYNQGLEISRKYRSVFEDQEGNYICQVCYDEGYEDPEQVDTSDDEDFVAGEFDE